MKKIITSILFVLFAGGLLFAVSDDYIEGYRQGYLDMLEGKPSRYPLARDTTKENNSLFDIFYFVDDFGDPTDVGYISQKTFSKGTFSNSATTNSSMNWELILAKDEAAIVIYEYGSIRLTGSYGFPDAYDVLIKGSDGKVYQFYCKNYSDRISVNSVDVKSFTDIFLAGGDVKIAITEDSKYSYTSYSLGTINCDGIRELYESL